MSRNLRLADLSPQRRDLVRLCQSINYGDVSNFTVSDRKPVLSEPCVVVLDVKLDSDQSPRQESDQSDFTVCIEVVRLMALLDRIQNGKISKLEVRAGIPRRVIWEDRAAEFRVAST